MDAPAGRMPDDLLRVVQDLLRKGSKIEAIKQVRERTGWGLKESKDAVEAVEAGRQTGGAWAAGGFRGGAEASGSSGDVEREVWDLLVAGRKIEAINRVRERDGCGLKEAKDKVEAVIARHPESFPKIKGTGCGAAILAVVVATAVCIWMWL
jgi:ribosomal protein L7/L12